MVPILPKYSRGFAVFYVVDTRGTVPILPQYSRGFAVFML